MKKTVLTLCLLTSPIIALAQVASNPPHVEQFERTGICISCDLSGISWLDTQSTGAINLSNSNLIQTSFHVSGSRNRQYSNFTNLKGLEFSMSYGDFSYSNFSNADLRDAYLVGNNMTSADFTGSNLSGVNFTETNLYLAKITQEQLNSVSTLCNAILPDGQKAGC